MYIKIHVQCVMCTLCVCHVYSCIYNSYLNSNPLEAESVRGYVDVSHTYQISLRGLIPSEGI